MNEAEYLKAFETFSPEKQQRHLTIIVRYLLNMIAEQEASQPNPLDAGAITLSPNVRRIEAK